MVKVKYNYCKCCGYSPAELLDNIFALEKKQKNIIKDLKQLRKKFNDFKYDICFTNEDFEILIVNLIYKYGENKNGNNKNKNWGQR